MSPDRIKNTKLFLKEKNIDALLISSVPGIFYLTNFSNFSTCEREAFLLITRSKQYIFSDARYSEEIKKKIEGFEFIEKSKNLNLEEFVKKFAQKHALKTLGVEGNNLTFSEYKQIKKSIKKFRDFNLQEMRVIKSKNEISAIKKSCEIADKTFNYVLKKIKRGVTEKQIAFEIEDFMKKNGADISFKPIVAFGENSSIPHHESGEKKLTKNNLILMDFGARLNNYCSDMTRVVFFGKATEKQKQIYQTVLNSQQKAIDFINSEFLKKGFVKARDADNISREYITSQNLPEIPHSLGHGVGIEVHEEPRLSPKSKTILKQGMVFSIEPGIYIPGFCGVRIEDLVTIDELGLQLLTHSTKELIEL
ncbi:Xaa-Pro peptidase family protein [Patescibacteria group bacterium]|nr:Xaa-Pro peptidase family protein [Patescibacteria group bacterium]